MVKDFSNDKYEYCLNTWGGFYNTEYKAKHGAEPGYFFFDSLSDLQAYLNNLKKIEQDLSAFSLATTISEGRDVRYKTIAKIDFLYEGKSYPFEYDFGYAYPVDSARFMFEDGNYGCDCNRSSFLQDQYGDTFPELECGNKIEMVNLEILQVKPASNLSFENF